MPLSDEAARVLVDILEKIEDEPQNLTAVRGVEAAIERHLLDSLVALMLPAVASASALVDLGSGVGFPGLALAAARPDLEVTLVESEGRKADWLRRASGRFPNVRVVGERTETVATRGRDRWPLATARALAPLTPTLELAAPLLALDGTLVVWRGERRPQEEEMAARSGAALGLRPGAVTPVRPFPGARRHLHEYRKSEPTPARFPRRPGRATARPL